MRKAPYFLLALILLVVPVRSMAGEPGDTGALFLRIGMGGRASGMGEAFTAVAKDASAVYWNPGAMAAVLGTNLMFMHNEFFQSVRLEQVGLTHETDWGTIGFYFSGLYMDEMDRYDDTPTAVPLGTFSAYDASFAVSYARYIIPNLAGGVTVKSIFQNIDESTAKGLAFDVGLYHVSRIEGVKFAAVLSNVGTPMNFEDDNFTGEEFELPITGKIGASFERDVPALKGGVLATIDVVIPNDGSGKQHIGLEYGYDKVLFLRGGYKAAYDSQGATFGLGVSYRKFDFDYAVLLVNNDLGDSHRLSLSLGI